MIVTMERFEPALPISRPKGRCPQWSPLSPPPAPHRWPSFAHRATTAPPHQVLVDPASLRPLSCTCLAGAHGRLCWAVVDVAAHDLEPIAHSRWAAAYGLDEIASAARVLTQVRRWAAAARELAALRSSGYVLTDRGRAGIADQVRA
jgi:hypothetical protein